MANHARIFVEKVPSLEELKRSVQEFVDSFQGLLRLEEGKGTFLIRGVEADDYEGVQLWLSEGPDETQVPEEGDVDWDSLPVVPCIEFRHGHGHDLFWYLDIKLENLLAREYNGIICDEGCGKVPTEPEKYGSYKEYKTRQREELDRMGRRNGGPIAGVALSLIAYLGEFAFGWGKYPSLEKEILDRNL